MELGHPVVVVLLLLVELALLEEGVAVQEEEGEQPPLMREEIVAGIPPPPPTPPVQMVVLRVFPILWERIILQVLKVHRADMEQQAEAGAEAAPLEVRVVRLLVVYRMEEMEAAEAAKAEVEAKVALAAGEAEARSAFMYRVLTLLR